MLLLYMCSSNAVALTRTQYLYTYTIGEHVHTTSTGNIAVVVQCISEGVCSSVMALTSGRPLTPSIDRKTTTPLYSTVHVLLCCYPASSSYTAEWLVLSYSLLTGGVLVAVLLLVVGGVLSVVGLLITPSYLNALVPSLVE